MDQTLLQSLADFASSANEAHSPVEVRSSELRARRRTVADIEREVLDAWQQQAAAILRYALLLSHNRETAHDAVQEAFLRYYLALVRDEIIQNPKAWLFRVARNYVLDQARDYAARNSVSLDSEPVRHLASASNPEIEQQQREMIRQAFALLSARELECLRLRTAGLNYEEIAQTLNLRSGTVGTLLTRGLKKIRSSVSRYQESR